MHAVAATRPGASAPGFFFECFVVANAQADAHIAALGATMPAVTVRETPYRRSAPATTTKRLTAFATTTILTVTATQRRKPNAMKTSRPLTLAQLTAAGACEDQRTLFAELYGESVSITEALCIEAAAHFSWDWAAENLILPAAWTEYKKARAAALAEFEKAYAPALAEFDKVHAPAQAEYQKALAEFDKVHAPAQAEYQKACAAALAEFAKARAAAWARAYINGGE